MSKKIHLHVGMGKTGTTALQNSLHELQKLGILRKNNFAYSHCYDDFKRVFEEYEFKKHSSDWLKCKLASIFNGFSCNMDVDNIIFSWEGFSDKPDQLSFRVKILKEILCNFKYVYIYIYVRRQDLFVDSIYNQDIKHANHNKDFHAFCENYENIIFYGNILKIYADYFGKENIIVRVYEREQLYKGDVVKDFLHTLGLEHIDIDNLPKVATNPSLSPEALRVRRAWLSKITMNEKSCKERELWANEEYSQGNITRTEFLDHKQSVKRKIDRFKAFGFIFDSLFLGGTKNHSKMGYMTDDARKTFLQKYAEDNAMIAREYLGREDGQLFSNDLQKEYESTGEPSASDVIAYLMPTVLHLHERIYNLEARMAMLTFENWGYEITDVPTEITLAPNASFEICGKIKNTSDNSFIGKSAEHPFRLGGRVLSMSDTVVVLAEFRANLPDNLTPQEQCKFALQISSEGLIPGIYKLVLDVVKEGEFWLEQKGVQPCVITLHITL